MSKKTRELITLRLTGQAPIRIKVEEWVEVALAEHKPLFMMVFSRGSGKGQEFLVVGKNESNPENYSGYRIWDERQLIKAIQEVSAELGEVTLGKILIGNLPAEDI
jgi:hypothetical protein